MVARIDQCLLSEHNRGSAPDSSRMHSILCHVHWQPSHPPECGMHYEERPVTDVQSSHPLRQVASQRVAAEDGAGIHLVLFRQQVLQRPLQLLRVPGCWHDTVWFFISNTDVVATNRATWI